MLTQFKFRWNKTCDMLDNMIQTTKRSKLKQRLTETKLYKEIHTYFIQNTPMLYHFIRNCNNNNIAILHINKKQYPFDYSTRCSLCYSFAMLNTYFRRKSFMKSYFILSLFFCRENFNFKSYKFIIKSDSQGNAVKPQSQAQT